MSRERELLQRALDALEEIRDKYLIYYKQDIDDIRAELAKPGPEPVECGVFEIRNGDTLTRDSYEHQQL